MCGTDRPSLLARPDLSTRLEFLYKIVEDTQSTIRFIDTKAVFCVTLLLGMVAAALQIPHTSAHLPDRVLFSGFMIVVAAALLICLRVIFPTIKAHDLKLESRGPHFFIGQNHRHQWILHTLRNRVDNVLNESLDSYLTKVAAASDFDLLSSMCDEVLMISLVRQVKSDRLHAAMLSVAGALLFLVAYVVI
jgi:hypothetical protein